MIYSTPHSRKVLFQYIPILSSTNALDRSVGPEYMYRTADGSYNVRISQALQSLSYFITNSWYRTYSARVLGLLARDMQRLFSQNLYNRSTFRTRGFFLTLSWPGRDLNRTLARSLACYSISLQSSFMVGLPALYISRSRYF